MKICGKEVMSLQDLDMGGTKKNGHIETTFSGNQNVV
jgi:hypothetical protein